jgi:hypothetical protein
MIQDEKKLKACRNRAPKRRETRRSRLYTFEFSLKVVQLHLPEGSPKCKCESIYHWIKNLVERISIGVGMNVNTPTVGRVAAKQWLLQNGLIQIVRAGNALPNLS